MPINKRSKPTFSLTNSTTVAIMRVTGAGDYVDGDWVPSSVEEVTIEANVQPAGYNDIRQVPESDRTKEWIKIFSAEPILGAIEGEQARDADIVKWDGKTYKVWRVKNYQMGVLDHYNAMAVRTLISAKGL